MVPNKLKYSKEHEWVYIDDTDSALVGVTQFAADSLGDVVFVDLPAVDSEISQFEPFGEIESVKAVSELFSPISGTIVEVNQSVIESPELVNENPYENGWLVRVSLTDPSELTRLMSANEYEAFIKSEGT